jgi:drug/metabolite transporter (DMT)-like permease
MSTNEIQSETTKVIPNHLKKAVFFVISAEFTYTAITGFVQWVAAQGIANEMIIFGQSLFCLLAILPWILYHRVSLKTHRPTLHLFRSVVGLANYFALYLSIRFIPLSDAMLLNTTAPLFVPLIVWIWSGIRPTWRLAVGLLIGFAGVAVVLQPSADIFELGAMIALGSALFAALAVTCIRYLASSEPPLRIIFYFFLISTIIGLCIALPVWQSLTLGQWGLLASVGVATALFQILLTLGFAAGSTPHLSALIYSNILFAGLFDWIFWDQIPPLWFYIGAVMIIAGGCYVVLQKKSKGN